MTWHTICTYNQDGLLHCEETYFDRRLAEAVQAYARMVAPKSWTIQMRTHHGGSQSTR